MKDMYQRWKVVLLCTFITLHCFSQTQNISGTGGVIPDDQAWHTYNCNVASLNQPQIDTTWGFERVTVNISHTWDADLEVRLRAPDGTEVLLWSGIGGDGDNFSGTILSNHGTISITQGAAPFTGTFRPFGDLGAFNNGQAGTGTWQLLIRDSYPQDQGTVTSWGIRFSSNPSLPYPPITSNLPIIKINTNGVIIPDEPKVMADFKIINHGNGIINHSDDTVYNYTGNIGIELRGSSSGTAPKPSYGFETWDAANNDLDTSLLGMPAESDWILSASYFDKTLLRNVLSYELFNRMGHYAPRTRFCELFLNGQYQGVYVLMEKIKRDSERVNVSKMEEEDTTGDNLTGGYILKIDKFTGSGGDGFYSNYLPQNPTGDAIFYQYEYPNQDEIQPQQEAYIQAYVDSFETALFGANFQDTAIGFRKFAGEKTFLDDMLINELSKNVDGYRLSSFFYKDKLSKGGKLKAGPVWDYDIAWGNAYYCGGDDATGWAYEFNYICPGNAEPAHWERMMTDTLFRKHVRCRWNLFRQSFLHLDSLNVFIDSTVAYIDSAQQRNFETWQILGVATWPQPAPIPQTYAEEIQRIKVGLIFRLHWMDSAINSFPVLSFTPDLGNDTLLCNGAAYTLSTGDYDNYFWSNGVTDNSISVNHPGNYRVTVSDEFGCSGTDEVNISYRPLPIIGLGNDTTICDGESLVIAASNFNAYQWSNGIVLPAITVSQSGNYALTVTDSLNCTASESVNVFVQTLPDAGFVFTSVNNLYQFTGADSAGKSVIWYFGDGDSSNAYSPLHVYLINGTYTVTHIVADSLGCTSTYTTSVNVTSTGLEKSVAKQISLWPNPSSDRLEVVSTVDNIETLRIVDVLGKCVFETAGENSKRLWIDVSSLAEGVYHLWVKSDGHTTLRRFVKQ